jgi:hypothetical protein
MTATPSTLPMRSANSAHGSGSPITTAIDPAAAVVTCMLAPNQINDSPLGLPCRSHAGIWSIEWLSIFRPLA